jgi:hypothetical protein
MFLQNVLFWVWNVLYRSSCNEVHNKVIIKRKLHINPEIPTPSQMQTFFELAGQAEYHTFFSSNIMPTNTLFINVNPF